MAYPQQQPYPSNAPPSGAPPGGPYGQPQAPPQQYAYPRPAWMQNPFMMMGVFGVALGGLLIGMGWIIAAFAGIAVVIVGVGWILFALGLTLTLIAPSMAGGAR